MSADFNAAMKSFYDTNGYLVVDTVFSAAEIAPIQQRIDAIVADPDSAPAGVRIGREGNTAADEKSDAAQNDAVRSTAFLVRFDPQFRAFARLEKLLNLVRGLIGPRVKVFRDQMLLKPPGGQAKPLHQDQSYFRVEPEDDLVTAWIALDQATIANGCMTYVPGSHRHGVFPVGHDPERPVHHVPLTGELDLPSAVACPVSAGSVIFHHGCTLHASADNNTDTWRRALIFHYAATDARSEKEELNAEISLEIDA
jgi:phytanoyl-CoA hydroxylase